MISWFKKHFVPHAGNDHRPHFLRKENICNIVVVILFLELFAFLLPTLNNINQTGGMASVLPAVLSSLTNEERQSQNLTDLKVNPLLVKAAKQKAEDMATKGYFAHTSPEGKTPWYWLDLVGYKYQYAGENLAVNFSDSKDVTDAWMNSPTHRANIVKDKYTEIGTGIASGMYKGKETIFVAQIYANPLIETKTEIVKKETEKTTPLKNVTEEKASKNVLGAEINNPAVNQEPIKDTLTDETSKITFFQKVISSPRNTTNIILLAVLIVIILAVLLNIFIKIKHTHPDLITNGLIVIMIIGAIFLVNYYLSHHNMTISQSFDYSNEAK